MSTINATIGKNVDLCGFHFDSGVNKFSVQHFIPFEVDEAWDGDFERVFRIDNVIECDNTNDQFEYFAAFMVIDHNAQQNTDRYQPWLIAVKCQ